MNGMDSNILVYALNKDLPEHEKCKKLLVNIAEGNEIISIPAIVFMESFHALIRAYKFKIEDVKKRIIAIIDSENINFLNITLSTILFAFNLSEEYNTGGRDSLIVASLLEHNIKNIYSHDKDFDKINLLNRIDPINIH